MIGRRGSGVCLPGPALIGWFRAGLSVVPWVSDGQEGRLCEAEGG